MAGRAGAAGHRAGPRLRGLADRRPRSDAARAQRETEQAREIARLREEQARLARDVHDVVGHSLAVILAQAESAQYLPTTTRRGSEDDDGDIATSARSSLQDVRQVLLPGEHGRGRRAARSSSLVDGVRASGHEVVLTEVGTPQPLPPELEVVALPGAAGDAHQRHQARPPRPAGVRRAALARRRRATGDLRIEVRNVEAPTRPRRDPAAPARRRPGQGLDGMRRRLDAVGGRLDVRRRERADGEPTFTVTAWVPVRAGRRRDATIRVLLVDDQDLFREGVRVIVDAQEGMAVVGAAGDGLEAVRLVDELAPDVVLMDIRMPEMDGVEATRQIFSPERVARRRRPAPVRVVVLTTFNLDDRAATAIRHGASGFLLKDTTPVMLRDAIRTVHAGNAVLAPADLSALLDGQFRAAHAAPAAYLGAHRQGARGLRRRGARPVQHRDRGAGLRSASRRSRPTSARSCASSACATGCRSSSSPTSTAWPEPVTPAGSGPPVRRARPGRRGAR